MKEAEKYYGLTGELTTYSTAAVDDLNTEEDIHLGFLDMKSRELVRLSKAGTRYYFHLSPFIRAGIDYFAIYNRNNEMEDLNPWFIMLDGKTGTIAKIPGHGQRILSDVFVEFLR